DNFPLQLLQFKIKERIGSTTGLRKHLQTRHRHIDLVNSAHNVEPLPKFLKNKNFNSEAFDDLVMKFVIQTNQPMSVLNSEPFKSFALWGQEQAKVPSNDTLNARCSKPFEIEQEKFKQLLASSNYAEMISGDDLNSHYTELETEDEDDSNTQYEYDSQDEEKI
ncbi:unnamed protein product, partial [Allacma fusca]